MAKAKKTKIAKPAKKKSSVASTAKKKTAVKKSATPKKSMIKTAKKSAFKKPTAKKMLTKKTDKAQSIKTPVVPSPIKKIDWDQFISPLDDRLIVALQSSERVTAGGLIIPDTAEISGNKQGIVLAAGPGHRDKKGHFLPMDVTVGDKVLFPDYSGAKLELQGQSVVIIRETDVLGIAE